MNTGLRILYGVVNAPRRLRDRVYCARLRSVCTLGPGARLTPDAVIHNVQGPEAVRIGAQSLFMGEIVIISLGKVRVGEWCFVGPGVKLWSLASIDIGARVFVSHGVQIFDNNSHSLSASERHERFKELREFGKHLTPEHVAAKPVRIEDDVWIGFNAAILKGVTVGRGAVIGAGTLVTRDVAPYAVMVGNPARQVGESRR
jgi:acetyltransferase-like isoleucine patch superfamily enzyme